MTREQIEQLPAGRELDALIAEKVMGWQFLDVGYESLPVDGVPQLPTYTSTPELQLELSDWLDSPAVKFQQAVGEYFVHVPTNFWVEAPDYSPSTDIAAAKQVQAKLFADGYDVQIWQSHNPAANNKIFLVQASKNAYYSLDAPEPIWADGETEALALAHVALLTTLT